MVARFIVGDTRAVTAGLADDSVDFLMTSPPFLALRSYLPADHPDKALEIGSEATPAEFIDVLFGLTAEWRRVLAPHGSIVVELGDTYSGSGGAGGDYNLGGLREGQGKFEGSSYVARQDTKYPKVQRDDMRVGITNLHGKVQGPGWPLAKSATLIPELYRIGLVYGINPLTGQPSPAGRWRLRNTVRWVRPNPPVGKLGDKWRPATSDLAVACVSDRRWWDGDSTRSPGASFDHDLRYAENGYAASKAGNSKRGDSGQPRTASHPAGAPLLDWWRIVPKGYADAHYATFPAELCTAPIDAMCPRRVCRTCGVPSSRVTETTGYVDSSGADRSGDAQSWASAGPNGNRGKNAGRTDGGITAQSTTTGWTTCGCPDADGIRLDGFHDGAGWRPGIVLDPFAGTATVLAVASGMGRDSIGIDLNARNADLALERVGPLLLTVEHHREVAA